MDVNSTYDNRNYGPQLNIEEFGGTGNSGRLNSNANTTAPSSRNSEVVNNTPISPTTTSSTPKAINATVSRDLLSKSLKAVITVNNTVSTHIVTTL